MKKTYFNWSTGKDSALALHHLMNDKETDVQHLVTSINTAYDRVTMHGLRRSLFEKQVESMDLPYSTIELPENPDMEVYGKLMTERLNSLKSEGFTTAGFGDIFLEDLREYREKQLASVGIDCVFPLWKRDTQKLMEEFLALGFKAIVICTDARLLDRSFVGRKLDASFLNDLPKNIDPCGENGEFHTFCFDGPIFKQPVSFEIGEKTYREYPAPSKDEAAYGYWFCDLM